VLAISIKIAKSEYSKANQSEKEKNKHCG